MASDKSEPHPSKYACRCLNVRITASQPPSAAPEYPRDMNYTPVYVKDDGISVIHPQVTARVPSKAEPILGTTRYSRFTLLICLFCGLPVYRVYHIISLDVDGAAATLLPSEDWVEHDIMKTATGWIDVHKDCIVSGVFLHLTTRSGGIISLLGCMSLQPTARAIPPAGDSIPAAQASSSYASVFSLALPSTVNSPPSSPVMDKELLTPEGSSPPQASKTEYLSHLRPLFLQPPFTSSHPIFVHLAGLATDKSQELRAAAEQRIADFVTAETAGIESQEKELKQQVETLWKNFKRNADTVQQEHYMRSRGVSGVAGALSRPSLNGTLSPSYISSSVTIRNFKPEPMPPQRHSTSTSAPRISALSASLANSKFYHPKALEEQSRSRSRSPSSNGTSSLLSPRSLTSTLAPSVSRGDGVSILQYTPNNDDDMNTQASYRYLQNLDEDMARYREATQKKQRAAETAKQPEEAGPSHVPLNQATNGIKKDVVAQEASSIAEDTRPEGETTASRTRDKGKRVTFVEPAPITNGEKQDHSINEIDDLFIFEGLNEGELPAQPANISQNTLPLVEQPPRPTSKVRNPRLHHNAAQDPFSSLRPSSLPNPSHIRPMRGPPGVDSSSQSVILSLPRPLASNSRSENQHPAPSSSIRPVNEREAAILKLVAADTPSHRGAWTPESKAWQTFTRRQDSKEDIEHFNIPEEDDDEADVTTPKTMSKGIRSPGIEDSDVKLRGIPGSMPVNILSRIKPREPLTLASYRSPTVVSEDPSGSTANPSLGPGNKSLSSAAIRKALYTERDRYRSIDPGALDFATEEDEEEEQSEESEVEQAKADDVGEKGRKHALKILQARNELPAEGMWRSLA